MYEAVFNSLKEELEAQGMTIGGHYRVVSDWEQAKVRF